MFLPVLVDGIASEDRTITVHGSYSSGPGWEPLLLLILLLLPAWV